MKSIFLSVIKAGGYDLSDMLKKIDRYHIEGKLTDEEKAALYDEARGQAVATPDVMAKLTELEQRIRKLEQEESAEAPAADYPEYVAGKWYYTGDKISYGNKHYVCSAPEGVVCTWNPDEYPAYWEELQEA